MFTSRPRSGSNVNKAKPASRQSTRDERPSRPSPIIILNCILRSSELRRYQAGYLYFEQTQIYFNVARYPTASLCIQGPCNSAVPFTKCAEQPQAERSGLTIHLALPWRDPAVPQLRKFILRNPSFSSFGEVQLLPVDCTVQFTALSSKSSQPSILALQRARYLSIRTFI